MKTDIWYHKYIIYGAILLIIISSVTIAYGIITNQPSSIDFNINEERAKDLLIDFEQQRMELEWEQQKQGQWIKDILNDLDYNITYASQELIGDEQNRSIQQNFTQYLNYYNLLKSMYPESGYILGIEFCIYYWNTTGIVGELP